jgi:hypothetical protein
MPSITYGGVKYIQVRHAIYCKHCKDTIESKINHEFKMCSCGSVGIDSDRIIGSLENIEQRSIYCAYVNGKKLWLPQEIIESTHLNIVNKYKQNDKVKGGKTQGNCYSLEKTT